MKLTKELRKQGFDLIEGPVRNHKPLQLWLKKDFDRIDLYYENIDLALKSTIPLTEIIDPSLKIDSSMENEFNFNIGVTVLDEILKSIGLANLSFSSELKSGKTVKISYDNSITRLYQTGEIEHYLESADFVHPNPQLLKHLNNDNIIIVTGIISAKNLIVEIETDFEINAELIAKLTELGDGKLNFKLKSNNKLNMTADSNNYFPIAIKASRIHYRKDKYVKTKLISDSRNFF